MHSHRERPKPAPVNALARRVALAVCALAWLAGAAPAFSQAAGQTKTETSLTETIARTGVFFRADAPAVLRNPGDPNLPVYLEIINGVEREGLSSLASAAKYIERKPLQLQGVEIFLKPSGRERLFVQQPLLLGTSTDYSFDARQDGKPLEVAFRYKKTLEIPLEKIQGYLKAHYLGGPFNLVDVWVSFHVNGWPDQDTFLRVRINAPPLPALPGWYRGDPHYHSGFTDNPAERGYPLDVTRQAALQAGMNWLVLSDHSTDLDAQKYAEELQEVKSYRDGRFLFIRGEEVTVNSQKPGETSTLHMLAFPAPDDPDKGFPDPTGASDDVFQGGDGAPGSPGLPLGTTLQRIAAAGGFAYAAHPDDPISPLLRGGTWDLNADYLAPGGKALQPGLVGLEPWNRATTATADSARDPYCERPHENPTSCFQPDPDANEYTRLEKGFKESWLPLLRQGLESSGPPGPAPPFKVFIAAGSDAHGDLNYEATMDVVDFLSRPLSRLAGYAENNHLGKISTVVECPQGMGPRGENVLEALREGRSVLSNGPLLIAGFDVNHNGSLDDPEDVKVGQQMVASASKLPPLMLEWVSSGEFGPLVSLRLMVGSAAGESKPVEISIPAQKALASGGLEPVDLRGRLDGLKGSWGYVRLEARTRNSAGEEFRCYTNPIWIRLTTP
jgi:hypothetical protein